MTQLFIYIYPPLRELPSHWGHRRPMSRVPWVHSRLSLIICFMHSHVYTSVSVSPFIPLLPVCSLHLCLYFCLANMTIYTIFQMVLLVKNPFANAGDIRDIGPTPRSGKIPSRKGWQPTPVFLPGESHEKRSLAGYSPQGHKEEDMTEVT